MNAELSRFVARGRDDTTTSRAAAYRNRFSLECGVITGFDRRVETVRVDMDDFPDVK